MPSLSELLEGRDICICAGSGGVGKTTTSAAIALGMASRGLKVCVLTIDPAKRLADSLGLEELGNEARRVDTKLFAAQGVEVEGELWAMMLDAKATFDELVARARALTRSLGTGCSATASTSRSPTRWPARRSTWRWRSCSSCTAKDSSICSSSIRRRPATRSTSSTLRGA